MSNKNGDSFSVSLVIGGTNITWSSTAATWISTTSGYTYKFSAPDPTPKEIEATDLLKAINFPPIPDHLKVQVAAWLKDEEKVASGLRAIKLKAMW